MQGLASSGLPMSFYGSPGYQTVTFSLIWRLLPQVVNIFHCWGFSSAKEHKNVMCIPWGGTSPIPRRLSCFLGALCLCVPSLTWLAAIWTCSLELREGCWGWKLFPTHKKLGTKRLLAWEPQSILLSFSRGKVSSNHSIHQQSWQALTVGPPLGLGRGNVTGNISKQKPR